MPTAQSTAQLTNKAGATTSWAVKLDGWQDLPFTQT